MAAAKQAPAVPRAAASAGSRATSRATHASRDPTSGDGAGESQPDAPPPPEYQPASLIPPDFENGVGRSLMTALRQSASWEDVPSEEDYNRSDEEDDEEERLRAEHRAQSCEAAGIDKGNLMACLQESASCLDIDVESDSEDERGAQEQDGGGSGAP